MAQRAEEIKGDSERNKSEREPKVGRYHMNEKSSQNVLLLDSLVKIHTARLL